MAVEFVESDQPWRDKRIRELYPDHTNQEVADELSRESGQKIQVSTVVHRIKAMVKCGELQYKMPEKAAQMKATHKARKAREREARPPRATPIMRRE